MIYSNNSVAVRVLFAAFNYKSELGVVYSRIVVNIVKQPFKAEKRLHEKVGNVSQTSVHNVMSKEHGFVPN